MGAQVVPSASHGMPALEVGDPNPPHIISRATRGGRTLWYCLKVIQQPERARACGSGPKSSADRRPVDPPPVVELRVYEGQTWEMAQDKDITFLYNANFFLYATLEHARVMAHGRVQTPAANTPPVLTGMPVSGMAYLDRPTEAGYFLFPDLSVRHEGRYRLTFNLYEETKEDKDKDPQSDNSPPEGQSSNAAMGGSFDFRMEIKSQDFVVYSAKKFPGLAESTALSRMVAEQGCRVRIRRDVRMRRRDGKGTGDYDNAEDEYARRPSRRTATPAADARPDFNRNRSLSGSVERTPYATDSQRRPSIADYPPQYPGQQVAPVGHLQFLNGGSNAQYPSQPPPQNFAQPPSVPASPVYPPSQTSYPAAPPPPPPSYKQRERTPSQSSNAPINPAPRRDSVQPHDFRSSNGHVTLPPLGPANPQHNAPHSSHHMPPPMMPSLPPIQVDGPQTSTLPPANHLSLPSPSTLAAARPNFPALAPGPADRIMTTQYAGSKRAHDQSFKSDQEPRRFQDGARDDGSTQDADAPLPPMMYRRADGQYKVPPPSAHA
ncbi:velvet factor-domain-containing protein [Triangularia verruculosa]|uniref:Velvet factor-domain-containing protein n=1 Tax=Triangularia verruculosa TaxID=2587418 RepID=A0AAN6X6U7_9PEZI|nr:velvet factor-domain-containing protein [Triangularia verruculosa]